MPAWAIGMGGGALAFLMLDKLLITKPLFNLYE
jgi:hypothetical protein